MTVPPSIQVTRLTVASSGEVRLDSPLPAGAAAAIGSFDGVHIGHQHVIESAIAAARLSGAAPAVICFDPHPHRFLFPGGAPFRLMRLPQQLAAFAALGVTHAVVITFDANLSALSAEGFARSVLHDCLKVSHVSAGADFQFGRRGGGHAKDLMAFGEQLGFTTDILPLQTDAQGHKLSSSAVRQALISGEPETAAAILGRPQAYLGEVIHGAKQGRTIDFPTLNIALGDYQRPRYGIYVTRTALPDGRVIDGVSNIGIRPTVGGDIELLETYLFDFSEEIYGQVVETQLLAFIRPEAKFDSFEALKLEIRNDAARARAWFAAYRPS